ncbi:hypothetical protein E1286_05075 [Nonomuraea terrae]|uniref:Uncharacterized protein n=1 Tax=Nonomuraea terrae TaxID=2530383 RepID=A0A4R4Z8Q7_9ACTN|nr:hypothetical protein [Nonomuraea terrae]TDD54565.1 hypothetical protein E1286_05075 [Nonomuraea terrae]
MSTPDPIPAEAVQAATQAIIDHYGSPETSSYQIATIALEAAAPVLAAQARRATSEQIAREIEAGAPFHWSRSQARAWAARIAREMGEARG